MAFYEQKVGLSLEFSMTSFWRRTPCRREMEWAFTRRNDWTLEEDKRDAGRQRELSVLKFVQTFTAQGFLKFV